MSGFIELVDYRRTVSDLYSWVRDSQGEQRAVWNSFREQREHLFREHPQSPLDAAQRSRFDGLDYFEYDPSLRYMLPLSQRHDSEVIEIQLGADGLTRMKRFGQVRFETIEGGAALSLYWILGYGGGVFLPFRDHTAESYTYGGGRYLLDSIKGADLGWEGDRVMIDFNYAYNPSCAYNSRWQCPLAPRENWLDIPIRAGEKAYAEAV